MCRISNSLNNPILDCFQMEKNFILTDVMTTGYHLDVEDYIKRNTLNGQKIDLNGNYYNLHLYNLEDYKRKIAMIDSRPANENICKNFEFKTELDRRMNKLSEKGFSFMQICPWESLENYKNQKVQYFPNIDKKLHYKWFEGISWFWFYMQRKHHNSVLHLDHSNKKFDFLMLLKRKNAIREKFYDDLRTHKILENSLFACHFDNKTLPEKYELPFLVDKKKYPQYGMDQELYELPYNESGISLVLETQVEQDMFITEKTWKPIITEQIFIIFGPHGILGKLKKLGFQTFSKYFDESYDDVQDVGKKMKMIIDLCRSLKNTNWKALYDSTKEIREHNAKHFFDNSKLSEQINKEILRWFEFVDGS